MRRPKLYAQRTKRIYRAEITSCLSCGARLRRYATLSERTVITLDGPIQLIHCGYRCPQPACPTHQRSYRSAAADALALPGFTFGLDIVVLVGQLRLAQQHSLDQTHQAILARLAPFDLIISRREVLYLFDAYCTLVRASQEIATDAAWHEQVRANGGIMLSLDGIQPDKGNETVYLVRDLLTGRVLAAENVRASDTATIIALLQPIHDLGLPLLEAISDAQESLLMAVARLWPTLQHQICQFHYLREASRPMYELDRGLRTQIRKAIQQPVRDVRTQIAGQLSKQDADEPANAQKSAQLQVLDDYALAIQTALNLEGQQPSAMPLWRWMMHWVKSPPVWKGSQKGGLRSGRCQSEAARNLDGASAACSGGVERGSADAYAGARSRAHALGRCAASGWRADHECHGRRAF